MAVGASHALRPFPQTRGFQDVESVAPSPSGGGSGRDGGNRQSAHRAACRPPGPVPEGRGFIASPSARAGLSGFTLVEVMVVVVLLGIAMAVVAPRISRTMFASDIKLATRQLSALVQVTRDRAVRSHRQYRLNYDLNTGELWVTYVAPSGEVVEDERTLVRRRRWPGRVRLVDVLTQFQGRRREEHSDVFTVFLPSGFIERSLLHVTDGDHQYTLVIDSLTGAVERLDGFVDETATVGAG